MTIDTKEQFVAPTYQEFLQKTDWRRMELAKYASQVTPLPEIELLPETPPQISE